MEVFRKEKIETDHFEVGDQIIVNTIPKERVYTATCQKVTKKKAIFLMDHTLYYLPMNKESKDIFLYSNSDLRSIILTKIVNCIIFDPIRERLIPFKNGDLLRIPFCEEFFGSWDKMETINIIKQCNKKQWPLMKSPIYRIGKDIEGYIKWTWLQNSAICKNMENRFAVVSGEGNLLTSEPNYCNGVRLVFQLPNNINKEKNAMKYLIIDRDKKNVVVDCGLSYEEALMWIDSSDGNHYIMRPIKEDDQK